MVPQLAEGIKTIKYWNYRLEEHGIQLANRSKLDRKYDYKEFHCINILSKHFPPCKDMIDYFPDFVF